MAVTLNASTSSGFVQTADTSGIIELQNNGTTKMTIGSSITMNSGGLITSGTAVASTSGTSIDFTGIPSWVKRITVMFQGVSTSGTSTLLIQLGTSGGIVSSGYISTTANQAGATASSTAGFILAVSNVATDTYSGQSVISNISSNNWVSSSVFKRTTAVLAYGAGDVSVGGAVTTLRITTSGGTDTFDAGTINILYEG